MAISIDRRFGITAFLRVFQLPRKITRSLFAVVYCFETARAKEVRARVDVLRLYRNEKSRFIPRGASVWYLKICLISSRWRTSFFDRPDFSTATRTSSSEWPGPLKCCATGKSLFLCNTSRRCSLKRSANLRPVSPM